MVVSRQAAETVVGYIVSWADKYHVPMNCVRELLLDLMQVKGNKSYQQTIELLLSNLPKPFPGRN